MNETNPDGHVAADTQQSEVAPPSASVADTGVLPTLVSEPSLDRETQSVDLASSIADTGPSGAVLGNRFVDVVSGQFDADEEIDGITPPKRVLAPMAETPKLHKVLAQSGMGSRLEMEQLIMEGRISVNNEPAHIGQRIQFGDNIKVNGKPIRFRIDPPPARVIAYHKPVGEVVTHDDPQNRPTVFRRLPKLYQGKWQSVGRLDLNTEGLLLFTSSGELANNLMHPRFVLGSLSKDEKQTLLTGVKLDDGMAQFGSIEDGGGEGSNCWYRVTISEGRNREVRRMLEAVGHAVSRLIRIRYGAMVLPRGLKRGAWMELDDADIRALVQASGGRAAPGISRGESAPRSPTQGPQQRRTGRTGGPRGAYNSQRGPQPGGFKGGNGTGPTNQGGRGDNTRFEKNGERRGAAAQPDPMKTAFGYIGADSFTRQRQDAGQKSRGPQGGQRRRGRGG